MLKVYYYNLSNYFLYKKLMKNTIFQTEKTLGIKELKSFHWKLTEVIKDSGHPVTIQYNNG